MNIDDRRTISTLGAIAWLVLAPLPAFAQWDNYGPGYRSEHSAVYDPTTQAMIVFGGQNLNTTSFNDVWLSSDVTTSSCSPCNLKWTSLSASGSAPLPRYGHSAVYDTVHNVMTIFGGATGFPAPCSNGAATLSHANGSGGSAVWSALAPSGTLPPARMGHAAGYDPTSARLIVFGGNNCNGAYFSDTWVLTYANGLGGKPVWIQLAVSGNTPPARSNMAAAYSPTRNTLTIFGGTDGNDLSDVWVLTNANGTGGAPVWTELSPAGSPPAARYGPAFGYDATNDVLMIHGGMTSAGVAGDAWCLANADGKGKAGSPTWTELMPSSTEPQLYFHAGIFAPTVDELVVFAGISNKTSENGQAADHMFTLTGANGLAKFVVFHRLN